MAADSFARFLSPKKKLLDATFVSLWRKRALPVFCFWKEKKMEEKNGWKTDPDADDAAAAVTSLAFQHSRLPGVLLTRNKLAAQILTPGWRRSRFERVYECGRRSFGVGEAVQRPNNSVGSYVGLDRRKEKKLTQIVLVPSALYEHATRRFVCQGRKGYWIGSMSK